MLQNLQIQDADGFDRFKNGIIVDNFTGHGIGDVTDNDYSIFNGFGRRRTATCVSSRQCIT